MGLDRVSQWELSGEGQEKKEILTDEVSPLDIAVEECRAQTSV